MEPFPLLTAGHLVGQMCQTGQHQPFPGQVGIREFGWRGRWKAPCHPAQGLMGGCNSCSLKGSNSLGRPCLKWERELLQPSFTDHLSIASTCPDELGCEIPLVGARGTRASLLTGIGAAESRLYLLQRHRILPCCISLLVVGD